MRTWLLFTLLVPFAANAQDACPNLAGTFTGCVSTIQGATLDAQQFVITQQGNQYTVVEADASGKTTTETYTADGSVITQTQNDPTYGQIVSTQQTSCVNNTVVQDSSSTVAGQPFFSMQQVISLNALDQLVMSISAEGGTGSQALGTVTCTRAN